MALELLSGPHLVIDHETGLAVGNLSQFAVLWVDPRGLIAESPFEQFLIQMDGAAFSFGTDADRTYGLQLVNGSADAPFVGDPWYSLKVSDPGDPVADYPMDRVTLLFQNTPIRTDAPGSLGHFVRVHDRYISVNGSTVRHWPDPEGSSGVVEATLTGMANASFLSWARERGHVWVGGTTGRVVRYDYINHVASSPVYRLALTTDIKALFYSAKHDVFVSMQQVGGTFEMCVWARTPLPASVSAPTASPAVAAGHASTLTVRVLGADSEPCPNEVVAWALTGEGALDLTATETDEDGYATNRLLLPLDAAGPSVQIDVEVTVP